MFAKNLKEYVATKVIDYLKERDLKMKEYEDSKMHIDKCAKCRKIIGYRFPEDYLFLHDANKFRRCSGALDDDRKCTFILCSTCDDEYDWGNNNSWFGVSPREIEDDDYCCPNCGD